VPVEIAVDAKAGETQVQLRMCGTANPQVDTFGYAGLRAK
jgi:hypothetical protein